jgi:tetratricopeptide (TPR) repeat protein
MLRFLVVGNLVLLHAGDPGFELSGRIGPKTQASVSIYDTGKPFVKTTASDESGNFRFTGLQTGTYAVTVRIRGRGEARRTVEVGPGTADARRRVAVSLDLTDSDFVFDQLEHRRSAVSTRELSIPDRAHREFDEGQKDLGRRAVDSAIVHLEKAVEIAPQYEGAWNNLGIIAYQSRNFDRAEQCFRRALEADPEAYEALINLGGVLTTLHRSGEAREFDERAVSLRPKEALANSQLGMAYFELGELQLSEKYLERARQIDPAHFSHPQLVLAQIHLLQKQVRQAAGDLEDFLKHHPDWPQAQGVRERIAQLNQ